MISDDLISLGLHDEEAKVYIVILELGGGYASTIAKKAKVHRVTCYNTLSNLLRRNLITFISRKNIRYYLPEPPKVLCNQFEEKYETARKVLPELIALQSLSSFTPKIRYYENKENIISIFEDMKKAKNEVLGYTNLTALNELFPKTLEDFATDLMKNKIKIRFLCPFDEENKNCINKLFLKCIKNNFGEILCVNSKQFPFKNGVFFYDDKMAIISYDKNELLGVIIQSAVNTQTQKAMFDLAWLGATSFIAK